MTAGFLLHSAFCTKNNEQKYYFKMLISLGKTAKEGEGKTL